MTLNKKTFHLPVFLGPQLEQFATCSWGCGDPELTLYPNIVTMSSMPEQEPKDYIRKEVWWNRQLFHVELLETIKNQIVEKHFNSCQFPPSPQQESAKDFSATRSLRHNKPPQKLNGFKQLPYYYLIILLLHVTSEDWLDWNTPKLLSDISGALENVRKAGLSCDSIKMNHKACPDSLWRGDMEFRKHGHWGHLAKKLKE